MQVPYTSHMTNTRGRTYFLLTLLIGATLLSFFVLQPFLTTIALAAIFAIVLEPVHLRITKKLGENSNLAALATLLVGCVLIIIPLSVVTTLVVNEAHHAYVNYANGSSAATAQQVAAQVGSWLDPIIPGATSYVDTISAEITAYAKQVLQWIVERLGTAFAGIIGMFIRTLIFLMALFYFIKDGARLEKALIKQSPLLDEDVATIFKRLKSTVTSVVKGSLTIACVQGTLAGIGYFIFGVPSAALWGVCTAVAALIPGMGTSLVIIPSVIYLFATGSTASAIGMLLWGTLLVGLIDNFLAPRLMGHGARLHPLATLLSVVGGVALYGPVGIFLGPLTLSFLFAVYSVYTSRMPSEA